MIKIKILVTVIYIFVIVNNFLVSYDILRFNLFVSKSMSMAL